MKREGESSPWSTSLTHRGEGIHPDEIRSLNAFLSQFLRNFKAESYPPPHRYIVTRPGDALIKHKYVGEPAHWRVVWLHFECERAFLSTERAARPPSQRQPVADEYCFLLEPQGEEWRIRDQIIHRRCIPYDLALDAMAEIQKSPEFQRVLERFGENAYATRLYHRPAPRPSRGLRRFFRRRPPKDPHPPERQLKFTLERWLPPGDYVFGDLFFDPRDLKAQTITCKNPSLAFTIEFWEMPGPRYVHWHFHGVLARVIYDPHQKELLIWQSFRV